VGAIQTVLQKLGLSEGAAVASETATGREVASVATLSAETSGMMSENYSEITDKFNKLADAIEDFGSKFNVLTEKVTSTRQIPGVDIAVGVLDKMSPSLGAIANVTLNAIDLMAKLHQKMIDLRVESLKTGAAFGLSADEIKRYTGQQLSEFGRLHSTLFVSKEKFDQYQQYLRNSAFSLKDLQTPITAWRSQGQALDYVFGISQGLGLDLDDTLRSFEASATKMAAAGRTQEEILTGVVKSFEEIENMSQRLGNVSAPYIKQQLFQAISGQEAAITNYDKKMESLQKGFEAFWVGLGPGQQGLAGEFLEKINKGFMDMSIGMAAWMSTPAGGGEMGDLADAMDLLMAFRGQGTGNEIVQGVQKFKARLQETFHVKLDAWENMRGQLGSEADRLAANHYAQIGMIMKQFKVGYDEGEKIAGLMAVIDDPASGRGQIENAKKELKGILSRGADVQKMQMNFLDRATTYVRGMYFKYMYGDSQQAKDIEKALGGLKEFQAEVAKQGLDAEMKAYRDAHEGKEMPQQMQEQVRQRYLDAGQSKYYDVMEAGLVGTYDKWRGSDVKREALSLALRTGGAESGLFDPSARGMDKGADTKQDVVAAAGAGAARVVQLPAGSIDTSFENMAKLIRGWTKKDQEGYTEEFKQRLAAMAKEYYDANRKQIPMTSGWRTYAEQEAIRRDKPWAAQPGTSRHEKGTALDISKAVIEDLDRSGLLTKYGFDRPYLKEKGSRLDDRVHVQLSDVRPEIREAPVRETAAVVDKPGDVGGPAAKDDFRIGDPANVAGEEQPASNIFAYLWREGKKKTLNMWYSYQLAKMKGDLEAAGLKSGTFVGEKFNGLFGATEGETSSLHAGEMWLPREASYRIKALGGVMGAAQRVGGYRLDESSRKLMEAVGSIMSGAQSLSSARRVVSQYGSLTPRYGLQRRTVPAHTDRRPGAEPMAHALIVQSLLRQTNIGQTEAEKLSDAIAGMQIDAGRSYPKTTLDKFAELIRRVMISGAAAPVTPPDVARPSVFAAEATPLFQRRDIQRRPEDLWPSIDPLVQRRLRTDDPMAIAVPPRRTPQLESIRPSELPIPVRAGPAEQLPSRTDLDPQKLPQKQPVFIKPNVTNRVIVENVKASVGQIVVSTGISSGEANDIPW